MADSITISQLPPPFQSMQYALLRDQGLSRIEELAGKIQTDFNAHDPGVTILEVLAYAITDLGYRTNYNIKDILTVNPDMPEDIKNFFQAKEIMPNYPVTFKDYRKLMIDVEIPVTDPLNCGSLGIKNAWIEISNENEILFYLDSLNKTLSYVQPDASVLPTRPKVLYDVLLEFTSCEALGDLNENTLEGTFPLYLTGASPTNVQTNIYYRPSIPATTFTVDIPGPLNGINVKMEVQFPRWDEAGVDWDNVESIRTKMRGIVLEFIHLPQGYKVDNYGIDVNGNVFVVMSLDIINPVNTDAIEFEIDEFIYNTTTGLIFTYQKKVQKIKDVLAALKARLMANRNLGEDFFRYNAIKVDEIALCADIDVVNNAVIEEVQAAIFHSVERFLDPTVFFYSLSEMYDKGKTTDEIFEGPLLQHGFIDDADLAKAERRKTIHVSDLIRIIMETPGVVAVKSIQIAGIPLDNNDNLPTDVVKWCLEVPLEKNYVPRLTVERSKIIFFKDQLPYKADDVKVQAILDQLEAADRPQKLTNPDDDIHLTPGEYKDIENYYSIQEEFPIVYGIGTPGLPATASVERRAQAKQLKGFLLFFDQLLANYLSQLFHVKDLFSMNEDKGLDGNPIINKTYFSQSLVNIVPDAAVLYNDPLTNPQDLQAITEDIVTYQERRNRFLDHLMARFSESFADYAMVVYKIDGPKAPEDLIQDKLEFLNNYPLISSARDTGFNYKDQCRLWNINNISGLERRASFLCGVDVPPLNELAFTKGFDIIPVIIDPDKYYLDVNDGALVTPVHYVLSPNSLATGFTSLDKAKEGMEKLVLNGVQPERYFVVDALGAVVPHPENNPPGFTQPYGFVIMCEDEVIGEGVFTASTSAPVDTYIKTVVIPVFESEFYDNPESNRYNLECFMDKYIQTIYHHIDADPPCPEGYRWSFTLTDGDPDTPKTLLTGDVEALVFVTPPSVTDQADANKERLLMDMLRSASDFANYRFAFDPSDPTKEIFNVVDRCGDFLGMSFEEDFNQYIQDIMMSIEGMTPTDNQFQVVGSSGNNGNYVLSNIAVDLTNARRLKLTVDNTPGSSPTFPIPTTAADGFFKIEINTSKPTLQPTVLDANTADNYFTVDKSLFRVVFPGAVIHINTGPDHGDYTVVKVVPDGLNSRIYVKEKIADTSPASPTMNYTLMLPITAVDKANNFFYITPGADEVAARELADWIKDKFFSHEGMHVVEHVLLRPKFNTLGPAIPISSANNNELQNVTPAGNATFIKQFALVSVNQGTKTFTINGNFAGDVQPLQSMRIVGSPLNDNTYTIRSALNVGATTQIKIYQNIPDSSSTGNLQYSKTFPIISAPIATQIVINDPFFVEPANNEVIITGSLDEINDGKFTSNPPSANAGTIWKINFTQRVEVIKDNFLPVDIDNDCGFCRFDNPYSYIVSVVLPAWQGRFVNQDFRKFFDRTLRLECPAHLVLNICWIDCKQMGEFELKYKKWLVENAKLNQDKSQLSKDLNSLIDVINQLRSVYPEGTLHDCETDSGEENAVILNNTVLGTL